jgi:hypothetical protein
LSTAISCIPSVQSSHVSPAPSQSNPSLPDSGRRRCSLSRGNPNHPPSSDLPWAVLVATILPHELDDTWSPDGPARRISSGSLDRNPPASLRVLLPCADTPLERCLELRVCSGNSCVEVEASREWIAIEWEQICSRFSQPKHRDTAS